MFTETFLMVSLVETEKEFSQFVITCAHPLLFTWMLSQKDLRKITSEILPNGAKADMLFRP
jgi:hypothetical protein